MRMGILGTGVVGQAIAGKLSELGHEVTIGTRDAARTLADTKSNQYGGPPFSQWIQQHPIIKLGTFTETVLSVEIIFNCLRGDAVLSTLTSIGPEKFAGKAVVDISNPLDFSHGMPPTLFFVNDNSLGEEIQKLLPQAHVVKTLNIVNAEVMVNPAKAGKEATMFLCGNDPQAKARSVELLKAFGWHDILDLGDITAARSLEMLLPIWLRTWMTLGSGYFAFKIVRP